MRLIVFCNRHEAERNWRIGALLDGNNIVDLASAWSRNRNEDAARSGTLAPSQFPGTMLELLRMPGGIALAAEAVRSVESSAFARTSEKVAGLVYALEDCVLDAPVRPGKLITVARNYREHLEESGVRDLGPVPSASIKATSSLVGPSHDIVRPAVEDQLDYETELAIVIGTRCKHVPETEAYGVIAGYTVLSDIIARQVLKVERSAGNQFLGKMFDTFGPMGPCIVTRDEIDNPMSLRITTRVNGELRQDSSTSQMIWSIPKLIAYFSQATLEPGDVISTGTPAGVAAGRKPGETPWFLQPGDVIESSVEKIGTLRNRIVEEPRVTRSWAWS